MKEKGKNVIIKGVLYEDGYFDHGKDLEKESDSDIYKFDSSGVKEAAVEVTKETAKEITKESAKSGFQAIVSSVQTQAANLGASGLIAVGSAGAFQVEHIHDHSSQAIEKATPMIQELVETGTIQNTIPVGHSKHGQEIPKVDSVLGIKVGDERKRAIEEKNKSDEQKAIEEQFRKSVQPPQPDEKDGSMTYRKEEHWSQT